MSLRIFHIVFIVVCFMLCLFVAGWGVRQYAVEGSTSGLTIGGIFFLCGVVLIIYGVRTFKKLKDLS